MADTYYSKEQWGDFYRADRQYLIDREICRAEWFPVGRELDRYGRTRRTFNYDGPHGLIQVQQIGNLDRWQVRIPVSREEQDARHEAWLRARAGDAGAQRTTAGRAGGARFLIDAALSVLLDDWTDREKVKRLVDLLASEQLRGVERAARGHLRLVVDNAP